MFSFTVFKHSRSLAEGRLLEEPNAHPLLTQQLKEMWAHSHEHGVPIRLTFEVTEANIVRDIHAKYVVSTAECMFPNDIYKGVRNNASTSRLFYLVCSSLPCYL